MTSNELMQLQPSRDNIADLRPLSMGRILDRAFRLYRRHFVRFLGIAALAQLPVALNGFLTIGFTSGAYGPFASPMSEEALVYSSFGLVFVTMIVTAVSVIWAQVVGCVLVQGVSDSYLGNRTTLGESFRRAGRSWMTVVGALLLLGLVGLVLMIIFIFPIVGWLLAIPGFGMFLYFSMVIIALMTNVIVLEKQGATAGIRRAWNLSRTRLWWLFGFFALLSLMSMLITLGPTYLLTGIIGAVGAGLLSPEMVVILTTVIGSLFGAIFYPISITSGALAYYDTRIRQEGLDLALQTLEYGEISFPETDYWAAVDNVVQSPPADYQRFRPTGREIGAFSLISLAIGGIMILLMIVVGMMGFLYPGIY